MVQLCRWKFSLSHNETLWQTLFDWSWLLFKKREIAFWATLGKLRLNGNVSTPSIARWKARDRLFIRSNWTFSLSLMVETLWAEICRSRRFSKGVGHFDRKFQTEWASPANHCRCQKLEWLPFRVVSKYLQCIVWFCHKACVWRTERRTDRQTARRTELRLPRPR